MIFLFCVEPTLCGYFRLAFQFHWVPWHSNTHTLIQFIWCGRLLLAIRGRLPPHNEWISIFFAISLHAYDDSQPMNILQYSLPPSNVIGFATSHCHFEHICAADAFSVNVNVESMDHFLSTNAPLHLLNLGEKKCTNCGNFFLYFGHIEFRHRRVFGTFAETRCVHETC